MFSSVIDWFFDIADFVWDILSRFGSSIGVNFIAVLAALCIVAAVIRLILRPFIGSFVSGTESDRADRRQARSDRARKAEFESRYGKGGGGH